ncbi:MAG: hypothetical protein AAFV53_41105 [Myxococcota bacterium]
MEWPAGAPRDALHAKTREIFGKQWVQVELADLFHIKLTPYGRVAHRWYEAVQSAAYTLEQGDVPTLEYSDDPYHSGQPVEWIRVLGGVEDWEGWVAVAATHQLTLQALPIGSGTVLVDDIAGAGQIDAIIPSADGYYRWRWRL